MKLKIQKWGINGEGIAYLRRKPVFIQGAIPGEIIDCRIEKEMLNYAIGILNKVIEESPQRRHPLCQHAGECGGCALMHVRYKGQCKMKETILREALLKYAGYRGPIQPIVKNPQVLAYRNSCKLPVREIDGVCRTGMYAGDSNRLIALDRCLVHEKEVERMRQETDAVLKDHHVLSFDPKTGTGIKRIVIKHFHDQIQLILVTGKEKLSDGLINDLAALEGVTSLWQSLQPNRSNETFGTPMVHLANAKNLKLKIHETTLNLLPKSFFQLNTQAAVLMYDHVVSLIRPCHTLVEAYCGIGAMSLLASDKAKNIIGIEWVKDAVENASENAAQNHISHARFICGDAGIELEKIEEPVDCLLVDPPRSGLDDRMKQAILQKQPEQMIYVSCNPSTLAKDLNQLKHKYRIESVQPFDLFSQTQHVETVVLLSHKKPDGHINVKVEFGEGEGKVPLDNIAKRAEAYKPKERVTYKMMKEYIEAKYGFKVHTAYIAEVKRSLGLPMYDAPKAVEELKHPRKHPTAEKVEAIKDALRHFENIS